LRKFGRGEKMRNKIRGSLLQQIEGTAWATA